jgi:hypothetical protein
MMDIPKARLRRRAGGHLPRVTAYVAAMACCCAVFAGGAWAAWNYVYFQGYGPNGQPGADFDVLYRNYNDSCIGDGYGWSKSIYGLADGSWVAAVDAYNNCNNNKAHLGPSENYGYTYVQSKCKNISGVYTYMRCNTSRP